jgi:hypothetical protein
MKHKSTRQCGGLPSSTEGEQPLKESSQAKVAESIASLALGWQSQHRVMKMEGIQRLDDEQNYWQFPAVNHPHGVPHRKRCTTAPSIMPRRRWDAMAVSDGFVSALR